MNLSSPKNVVFIISVILIVVGLLSSLVAIPFISRISNWVSFAGGAILALGCLLKGF